MHEQDHPYPSGKLPYGWTSVADYWPSRLLHIPTMTSVERDGANVYAGAEKPKYNILTYTWGRWRIRTNPKAYPALGVRNTRWDIPPIKADHFSVEEFQNVVDLLAKKGVDWAWIDVACIDQDDQQANAEEVGQQVSIFKNAHRVFVWLSHLEHDVLAAAVATIQDAGLQLRDHVDKLPTPVPLPDVIASLHRAFNVLFADPWFSSLWTLQEVVLRNDALVLSKQASPVVWNEDHHMFLTMFINHCQNVFQDLEGIDRRLDESRPRISALSSSLSAPTAALGPQHLEMKTQILEMKQLILRAGFYFLFSDNPNVQYGIARYRTTSRDVDRVYAIMQIYHLRVGASLRPGEQPTLPELIDEFAVAINKMCPILGQMFVHTQAPEPLKSWRITEKSTVPDSLRMYKEPRPRSELTVVAGTMVARGPRCPFSDLLARAENQDAYTFGFRTSLDAHVIEALPLLHGPLSGSPSSWSDTSLGHQVLWLYGVQNVWVLWLGDIRATWNIKRQIFLRAQVGLLLARVGQDGQKLVCQRLGVCVWTPQSSAAEQDMNSLPWVDVELQLH
jgi:hypothetical protein